HTAAGKLQGLPDDAAWYEAAYVAGVTNALNVVADSSDGGTWLTGVLPPVDEGEIGEEGRELFTESRAVYECVEVAVPFRVVAHDVAYLADLWKAVRRAFDEARLSRRLKEGLAFAVSVTSRSRFGSAFHGAEMRRLGVGTPGVQEILGVTRMFSSYTKIADTLQLESDMAHIAGVDRTPAPGGTVPS